MTMHALALCLAATVSATQPLDGFAYRTAADARAAWRSAEGTPPVDVLAPPNGSTTISAMVLEAPFGTERALRRSVIDRDTKLDLRGAGGFELRISIDRPAAINSVTLYLRSGDGWYGASARVRNPSTADELQTLRFPREAFRAEGRPKGWSAVDGIRIAAWRGAEENARVLLHSLIAATSPVAIVVPDRGEGEDVEAAEDAAEQMSAMLADLGLTTDRIPLSAAANDALGSRAIAILAYNPGIDRAAEDALLQFIDSGGQVFACYQIPERLAAKLGLAKLSYVRPEPGTLAEVHFDSGTLARLGLHGMPDKVGQRSWNIVATETSARVAGEESEPAHVIGRWFDAQGRPTPYAALTLNPHGAFFSHLVLPDDRTAKLHMLAAIFGHFEPDLWPLMVEKAVGRAAAVGHRRGVEALRMYCQAAPAQRRGEALAGVERGQARISEACRANQLPADQMDPALDSAAQITQLEKAHQELVHAYLVATPSRAAEGRAVWNHSGTGAYAGDWDRSARELAAAGFNMVLPNMLWGGIAHYPSELLPQSSTFRRHGDQVSQCCKAAARHGLEVHVWKVNFNLTGASAAFVSEMRAAGRTQVSAGGKPLDWLCPSHPENRRLECESMLEVARRYPVAGLHFDYIRYPGRESCFCDGCRQRFEMESGQSVIDWPKECHSGGRREQYNAWRCQQITALVRTVREKSREIRPDLKLSAAVFGKYPDCREGVAQDWPLWVREGYLDFVCPMNYTTNDEEFVSLVREQQQLVAGRVPIYPGIGATASRSTLSPDRVVGQIVLGRQLGAAGFTLFDFHGETAESIIPAVGLGAGSEKAVPPHSHDVVGASAR
ncbi:MAG: glycoside hydrolase family 10 protein [Planctomycetota bacterium]